MVRLPTELLSLKIKFPICHSSSYLKFSFAFQHRTIKFNLFSIPSTYFFSHSDLLRSPFIPLNLYLRLHLVPCSGQWAYSYSKPSSNCARESLAWDKTLFCRLPCCMLTASSYYSTYHTYSFHFLPPNLKPLRTISILLFLLSPPLPLPLWSTTIDLKELNK